MANRTRGKAHSKRARERGEEGGFPTKEERLICRRTMPSAAQFRYYAMYRTL